MKQSANLSESKPHYEILDGLRGVAAILVVLFHVLEIHSHGDHSKQIMNHGYLAVDFFFMLSGFVISYAYDDRWNKMTLKDFFKRRIIRLHPMIIIGMIIGAALFYLQDSPAQGWGGIHEVPVWKMLLVMIIGFTLIPVGKSLDILIQLKENKLHEQRGLLKAKFEEIMYYLLHKNGSNFVQSIMPFKEDEQKSFKRVVESNKLNNLTLQELSFLCNMSISTFKRNFKKHYQVSPIKWFLQKRLEHAAYLLNVEKRRPSDIYLEVGFESLSSFTQAFKQEYNSTPKQFQTSE